MEQTTTDSFADAIQRMRAEFLEMPGLTLTVAQAARLWTYDPTLCQAVLAALVDARFLVRTRHSAFARAEDDSPYAIERFPERQRRQYLGGTVGL